MKQVIQSYRTGELWLAEVPALALRQGGAIVQTAASLVSAGTERAMMQLARQSLLSKARLRPDLVKKVIRSVKAEGLTRTIEKVLEKLDTPISLGYSCAGTVIEAAGDTMFRPGDRVACAGAGFATHAEQNFVPTNLLARVPDSVSFEDAAFTTVGAVAMQGVRQADASLGERVAVIGLGLIGLVTVQLLHAAGCMVLSCDIDPAKCDLARDLGATACHPDDLLESAAAFSDGHGVDAVIITAATSSNQPIEQAGEICRAKARVIVVGMVGMDVPREPFYRKELDLRMSMSYGPGRYDPSYEQDGHDYPIGYVRWTEQRNMESFLKLMADGKITPARLISHRFKIENALDAYTRLAAADDSCLGIIIEYSKLLLNHAPTRTIGLRTSASSQIGIGVIGPGNFARSVLLPALSRIGGMEFVGVCASTGSSALHSARRHGFAYATTDHRELLSDPHVNVVFVATPHDSHAGFACDALRAGMHVFVEKPLCTRPEELKEYEQAIQASPGRCLMIGFNRRFSPHTQAVCDVFANRQGPISINYRINAGATGNDRIVGEVCHFIDWCEHVTGSIPANVQAESIRGTDSVVITIRYQDDSLATIQYITSGPLQVAKERIEIFANGRCAMIDDFVRTTFHGVKRRSLKTRQDKGFAGELAAFFNTIRNGGAMPIGFDSMVRTTQMTFNVLSLLGRANPLSPTLHKLAA